MHISGSANLSMEQKCFRWVFRATGISGILLEKMVQIYGLQSIDWVSNGNHCANLTKGLIQNVWAHIFNISICWTACYCWCPWCPWLTLISLMFSTCCHWRLCAHALLSMLLLAPMLIHAFLLLLLASMLLPLSLIVLAPAIMQVHLLLSASRRVVDSPTRRVGESMSDKNSRIGKNVFDLRVPVVAGIPCFSSVLVSLILLASLLWLCQCCCQHHCLADTVAAIYNIACIPAITRILLLMVSSCCLCPFCS